MKKQHLIVAVKEAVYLDRLAEYIRHSAFGEEWQLTAFTNVNALRQYLRSGYPVDLLAVQSSMVSDISEVAGMTPLAVLTARADRPASPDEVLQFQPLPALLQALTAVYATGASHNYRAGGHGGRRAVIAAVGSAAAGIGKTTFAIRLGQQAGARGAQVFYLNLEQWNATSAWFGPDEGGDHLSHMLYTLQAEPNQAVQKLAELKRRHPVLKLDYLPPCRHAEERLSMTAELVERLVAAIAESGLYDLVLIDTDNRMDAVMQAIVQRSDLILWLLGGDVTAQAKNKLVLHYAQQQWGDRFQQHRSKFRYLAVQQSDTEHSDLAYGVRIEGVLPFHERTGDTDGSEAGGSAIYRSAVDRILNRLHLLGKGGDPAGRNDTSA